MLDKVLELVKAGKTIDEIARELSIPKAEAEGALKILESMGYVEKVELGEFSLRELPAQELLPGLVLQVQGGTPTRLLTSSWTKRKRDESVIYSSGFWVYRRIFNGRKIYKFRVGGLNGDTMKAVILAGGFGTRLRPLSSTRPKPMIPVLGKPNLQYLLESLEKIPEIDEVILSVHYMRGR